MKTYSVQWEKKERVVRESRPKENRASKLLEIDSSRIGIGTAYLIPKGRIGT